MDHIGRDNSDVEITYYPVPMDEESRCRALVKPTMLLEVIDDFAEKFPEYKYDIKKQLVEVFVNGEVVPSDRWHLAMLEIGDYVEIRRAIHGGRGGTIQTIVGVVLIAAALIMGPETYPVLYNVLLAAGIGMTISGVISMILPPPALDLPSISGGGYAD